MNDFSLVLGVDGKHLEKLGLVWPTWEKNKPSTLKNGKSWRPLIIFYDADQVKPNQIKRRITHPHPLLIPWPPRGVFYQGDADTKWFHPQRMKMLSGFVHVAAFHVDTPYWLKLDLDVVAAGNDDWIKAEWFKKHPAIVCHRWGFTKPADQMLQLDAWVERNKQDMPIVAKNPPLNLVPNVGWERIQHPRIISWCGFFCSALTKLASALAMNTVGEGQLPVPSQDGYLWYLATRLGLDVVRTNMKEQGWEWWSTDRNIRNSVKEVLGTVPWYHD